MQQVGKKIRQWAITAMAAAAAGGYVSRSTADALPDEVVITGQLEESLPRDLERYGTRLETLDSQQIQRGGYYDVAQALQALTPGMYVAPLSGPFDYAEVSFQGSRNSEVLWLVDGMRINNRLYSTTTPLDTLPAHLIERIEILEGGEGLFFGTQAVAGTVNIVTKDFANTPEGRVSVGVDSNDGRHLNGYYRAAAGKSRFVLFASKDDADGFQPFRDQDYQPSATDRERGYEVVNVGGKYAYEFSRDLRASIGYQYTDATLDYARPRFFARATNDRDEHLLTAKVDFSRNDHLQFFVKGYYHKWDTLYNEVDNTSSGPEVVSDNEFWGFKDYGANMLAKFTPGGNFEYLLGYDFQHYSGEDQVFLIAPDAETVHAPFAQIRTTPALLPDLHLSLGVRYNSPDNSAAATVWNANAKWEISRSLFGRTSFGTAFRLPDAYELFVIDPCCEQGNPNLKPERSKFLNISVGGRSDGTVKAAFGWELIGFFRDVEDVIQIVSDPVLGIDTLENTPGTTKVRGGELVLSMQLANGLSGNASYTLTDARLAGTTTQQQEVPKSLAKLAVAYQPEGSPVSAGLTLTHVGDTFRNVAPGRTNYGNYYVLDLNSAVHFGVNKRHHINLRLENALDEEYASRVRDIAPDSGGSRYTYWFLGTPRTLHVSYSYDFAGDGYSSAAVTRAR